MKRIMEWFNRKFALAAGILILFAIPEVGLAGGPVDGAKASGMGTAFIAVADDLSAIAINPAGLTSSSGTNIYGGVTAVFLSTTYESLGGESQKTNDQINFPPQMYISSQFDLKDWFFGLGIFSPFGIGGRDWPEDGLTRYISTEGFIATINANPTMAWKVSPHLSLGVGLDLLWVYNYSKAKTDQLSLGAGDGQRELTADGTGWGFNLGLLYKPVEKFSIGIAFRSAIEVDQKGTAEISNIAPALQPITGGESFKTDIKTTLHFPEILSFGVAWKPANRWVLALDVEWANWSRFNRMDIDFIDEIPQIGLIDTSQSLDWVDAWQINIGVDYRLTDTLFIRGGYAFIETPVPDKTLSPANPDADLHIFSLGIGYRFKRLSIDAFYMPGFYEDRTVNNDILSGFYKNNIHYAGVSIGFRF